MKITSIPQLARNANRLREIIRPVWSNAYVSPEVPARATDRIRENS